MSSHQVKCPKCGEVKNVTPNTQHKCSGYRLLLLEMTEESKRR